MKRPVILVPIGDVCGIGPEIVCKSFADPSVFAYARPVAVGDRATLEKTVRDCNLKLSIRMLQQPNDAQGTASVLEMVQGTDSCLENLPMGKVNAAAGKVAFDFINSCVSWLQRGQGAAMATAPINKESFRAAGIPFIGHTEAISALMGVSDPLTMFQVRNLRVFFLSRHLSLRDAVDYITFQRMHSFIHLCAKTMRELGIDAPRIAVAGLNPHCGEHGLFGSQEMDIIEPAIVQAQAESINVVGPIGADSVFWQALQGKYDCVLSLYHDQGHIATKTVDFERTISLTLGLPYLRTSVDHGTAFDIAGHNMANAISMIEAIRLATVYC